MIAQDFPFDLTGGGRIVGRRKTVPVTMPTPRDQTPAASDFRQRNAGKSWVSYEFNLPFAGTLEGAARWADPPLINLNDLPDPFDARLVRRVAYQTSGPIDGGNAGWRRSDGVGVQPFDWHDFGAVESEDSCWLTVQTPIPQPGADLPVRVVFHGGGNTQNPRSLPRYGGESLPLVTVLVEYPLSTFGFFTHPALGESHQINTAYLVMIKALEWVQQNVAQFGGDPNRVMIEGGSAGGAACTLLMPQASGLFHRSLAHSAAGVGRRSARWRAQARGALFWKNLIKSGPAYYDPSRTIAEIAEQDGVAAALRLGPSPEQILAFGNARTVYEFTEGGFSTSIAPDVNIWPARDGVLIDHDTAVGQVVDDAWPTSVPYMATYVANEAGLIDNAREVDDPQDWFGTLGIGPDDQAAAIALLSRPGDRWQRRLYGALYGYGAERLCREHSTRGGAAFYGFFSYDSLGNGRDRPSHVNQQAYFINKPQWQIAQGETDATALLYETDFRVAWQASRFLINFAANGDPNDPFVSRLEPVLYDGAADGFDAWPEFGGADRNFVSFRNSATDQYAAEVRADRGHERELFDFIDARFVP